MTPEARAFDTPPERFFSLSPDIVYLVNMITASFQRLPQSIQKLVTDALDEEIQTGFEKIGRAQKDSSADESAVRFIEGDIVRASALRKLLTGEAAEA